MIKKIIKIIVISLLSIVILGGLTILLLPKVRIAIAEHKYLSSGDSADLINLCGLLCDTNEYEKLYKYMPKVVNINDFNDNFMKSNLAKDTYKGEKLDPESTYSIFTVECMFSYIYTKHYDEYLEAFPLLYEKMMSNHSNISDEAVWQYRLSQTKKNIKRGI